MLQHTSCQRDEKYEWNFHFGIWRVLEFGIAFLISTSWNAFIENKLLESERALEWKRYWCRAACGSSITYESWDLQHALDFLIVRKNLNKFDYTGHFDWWYICHDRVLSNDTKLKNILQRIRTIVHSSIDAPQSSSKYLFWYIIFRSIA